MVCELLKFEAIKINLGQKRPVLQSLQFHLVLKLLWICKIWLDILAATTSKYLNFFKWTLQEFAILQWLSKFPVFKLKTTPSTLFTMLNWWEGNNGSLTELRNLCREIMKLIPYQKENILRIGGGVGMCINKELVKNCRRRRASRLWGTVSVLSVFVFPSESFTFWTCIRLVSLFACFCCKKKPNWCCQ